MLTEKAWRRDLIAQRRTRCAVPTDSQERFHTGPSNTPLAELRTGEPIVTKDWYDVLHRSNEESPSILKMRAAFARGVSHIGQFSWVTTNDLDRLILELGIGRESRVLDLCCGCGGPLLYIASQTGCAATGVDISSYATASAAEKALALGLEDRITFVCANAGSIPLATETFASIISFGAFINIRDRLSLLRECNRVLRPGGFLAFFDQISYDSFGEGEAIPPEIFDSLSVFVPHYFLTPSSYSRLLSDAGFESVKVTDRTAQYAAVNQAWMRAFEEVWDDLVREHGKARIECEYDYLRILDELATNQQAGEALFVGTKPLRRNSGWLKTS